MANNTPFIHDLRGNHRPKILLIGNGIERLYGSSSWNELIDLIDVRKFDETRRKEVDKLPFPERYELLATPENAPSSFSKADMYNEEHRMKQAMSTLLPSEETRKKNEEEHSNTLFRLLPTLGVDHIFTTNYTYCPEEGFYPNRKFEKPSVRSNIRFNINPHITKSGRQSQENGFRLHSGYFATSDKKVGIWHIHGECGAPTSVILGHDKYGRLLKRIVSVCDDEIDYKKIEKNNTYEFRSWPELFLFGDIYVVGFGYAECEFDLWWLLRRKQRETHADGKVYFYEYDRSDSPKKMLLYAHGVEIIYNEFSGMKDKYKEFYECAFDDIRDKCNSK
jgi:hypothetical protein